MPKAVMTASFQNKAGKLNLKEIKIILIETMRIGIVCYPSVGGSGVMATELGHELARRGHEVHFITYAIPFRLRLQEKNIFFHEVEIDEYDLFQYPDYALTLAVKISEVAEENDLDILHTHYAIPHATSAFLARKILHRKKPKIITTLHGTDITLVGKNPSYFRIVKFSIEESDGVTAVSEDLKAKTQLLFGAEKEIQVIYNFFTPKPEVMGDKSLRGYFASEEEKLIIHASNFRPVKRALDVLHIYCKIKEKMSAKLLLVGSGEALGEVRKEVADKGLERSVHFLGHSREIDRFVAASDLFLLPSEQESFGLVALESMAYGIPVVASRVGGIPEVVEDGKTGFLAPVGAIDEMAEKALRVLNDPVLYETMSKNGQQRARELFSNQRIVCEYEAYYQKILASP